MTYLIGPRLHFTGTFQANVSTVNNNAANFDVQSPDQPPPAGGGWNPDGSGTWSFANCAIGAGVFADGREVTNAGGDPVVGQPLASIGGIPPKLVDLDTEQQMVSQIFGMTLSLGPSGGPALMTGSFVPAPFTDIWLRPNQSSGGDDQFGATFQSVLTGVTWGDVSRSPLLQALQTASEAGLLSIKFNVDGFQDESSSANFTFGRVVGTIGAASSAEPKHFVLGRQFRPVPLPTSPFSARAVSYFAGVLDPSRRKLVLDLGNAFHTDTPGGAVVAPANVRLIARKADQSIIDLGPIDTGGSWNSQFAGIWAAPPDRELTLAELNELAALPIELVQGASVTASTTLAAEHPQGLHVRADNFVFRMSPGDTASVDLVVSEFGIRQQNIPVATGISFLGTPEQQPPPPTPAGLTVTTGGGGAPTPELSAHDLGADARQFIDGQVYGLTYALQADTGGTGSNANPSDFVSVLVWSAYQAPANPTWWQDVYPIFEQYADLYPYMNSIIDLGDYGSVVSSKAAIARVFGLPVEDPHYMPVTRDLSPARRQMLIGWLNQANPPEGQAPAPAGKAGANGKAAFIASFRPPRLG